MIERWVKPLHAEWPNEGVSEAIQIWERDNGVQLPNDYRSFMTRYDGGRVYPLMFRHTAREPGDAPNPTEHFVDPFYDWGRVVTWRAELGDRLPKQCLVVGGDPGLIELVMSLRQDDYGHIYSWVRNFGGPWPSPDNDYLCLQASAFREFVEGLFENADGDGRDYWDMFSEGQEPLRLAL